MKSYTDVEQSKKLAEILPLESADMAYLWHSTSDNPTWRYDNVPMILADVPINDLTCDALPCWSLAALLSVIPNVSINTFKDRKWNAMVQHGDKMIYGDKDTPVDACYEIIIKLYELKLL